MVKDLLRNLLTLLIFASISHNTLLGKSSGNQDSVGKFLLEGDSSPILLDYTTIIEDCLKNNEYLLIDRQVVFVKLGFEVKNPNVSAATLKHLKAFLLSHKKSIPRLLDMLKDKNNDESLDVRKDLTEKIMVKIGLKEAEKPKAPKWDDRKVFSVKSDLIEDYKARNDLPSDQMDPALYQFESEEKTLAMQQALLDKYDTFGKHMMNKYVKKLPQTMFSALSKQIFDRSIIAAFEQAAALIPDASSPFYTQKDGKDYFVLLKERDSKTQLLQEALEKHGRIYQHQLAQLADITTRVGEPVVPSNSKRRFADYVFKTIGFGFELCFDAMTRQLMLDSLSYRGEKKALQHAKPVLVASSTVKFGEADYKKVKDQEPELSLYSYKEPENAEGKIASINYNAEKTSETWELAAAKKSKGEIFLSLAKKLFFREAFNFVYSKAKKPVKAQIAKTYDKVFPEFDPKDLGGKPKEDEHILGVVNSKGNYHYLYINKDALALLTEKSATN